MTANYTNDSDVSDELDSDLEELFSQINTNTNMIASDNETGIGDNDGLVGGDTRKQEESFGISLDSLAMNSAQPPSQSVITRTVSKDGVADITQYSKQNSSQQNSKQFTIPFDERMTKLRNIVTELTQAIADEKKIQNEERHIRHLEKIQRLHEMASKEVVSFSLECDRIAMKASSLLSTKQKTQTQWISGRTLESYQSELRSLVSKLSVLISKIKTPKSLPFESTSKKPSVKKPKKPDQTGKKRPSKNRYIIGSSPFKTKFSGNQPINTSQVNQNRQIFSDSIQINPNRDLSDNSKRLILSKILAKNELSRSKSKPSDQNRNLQSFTPQQSHLNFQQPKQNQARILNENIIQPQKSTSGLLKTFESRPKESEYLEDYQLPQTNIPLAFKFQREQENVRKALIAQEEELALSNLHQTNEDLGDNLTLSVQRQIEREIANQQSLYNRSMFPDQKIPQEETLVGRVVKDVNKQILRNENQLIEEIIKDILDEIVIELTEQEEKTKVSEKKRIEDFEKTFQQLNQVSDKLAVGSISTKQQNDKKQFGVSKTTIDKAFSYRKEREYYQRRFVGGRNLISVDTAQTADFIAEWLLEETLCDVAEEMDSFCAEYLKGMITTEFFGE